MVIMEVLLTTMCFFLPLVSGGTVQLEDVMDKMSNDALDLKNAVVKAYHRFCESGGLNNECAGRNFLQCASELENPSCLHKSSTPHICVGETNTSATCGIKKDFTNSEVTVPNSHRERSPPSEEIIRSVCFAQFDEWLRVKYGDAVEYYERHGIEFPLMYFGSDDGVFRYFPGYDYGVCGTFNPTERPWYLDASSVKKDIVLLIDTTTSLSFLERAALAVVRMAQHTNEADHISLVATTSDSGANKFFVPRNNSDAENGLASLFHSPSLDGNLSFHEALMDSLDTLDQIKQNAADLPGGASPRCNTALIYLHTGGPLVPDTITLAESVQLIQTRLDAMQSDTTLFAFQIVSDARNVSSAELEQVLFQIGGLWLGTFDHNEDNLADILYRLRAVQRFYTYGLQILLGDNHTVWSMPYAYEPSKVEGTTVSAPVYSKDSPPLFLGVVGIDIILAQINEVAGADSYEEARLAVTQRANDQPCLTVRMKLSPCQVQTFRKIEGIPATDPTITALQCANMENLSSTKWCSSQVNKVQDLWNNENYRNLSLEDRSCCWSHHGESFNGHCRESEGMKTNESPYSKKNESGPHRGKIETSSEDSDQSKRLNMVQTILVGLGSAAATLLLFWVILWFWKKRTQNLQTPMNSKSLSTKAEIKQEAIRDADISIRPTDRTNSVNFEDELDPPELAVATTIYNASFVGSSNIISS